MPPDERLSDARKGYQDKNMELAARAHDPARILSAEERHGRSGTEYIGSLVYGGLDGIITTFAVVSGVEGAQLSPNIVLILGLANLLGDGVSMAAGAYLSSKSERELYERERQREAWEVDHFPEGEKAELIQFYLASGYSQEDADTLVEIKSRDKKRWVDAMMIEELGMLRSERKPILEAAATFGSFLVAGTVPLLVYLGDLLFGFGLSSQTTFFTATGLTALALFGLGAAKVLITERSAVRSGLEMLLVGGAAAGIAYAVGAMLKGLGVGGA